MYAVITSKSLGRFSLMSLLVGVKFGMLLFYTAKNNNNYHHHGYNTKSVKFQ